MIIRRLIDSVNVADLYNMNELIIERKLKSSRIIEGCGFVKKEKNVYVIFYLCIGDCEIIKLKVYNISLIFFERKIKTVKKLIEKNNKKLENFSDNIFNLVEKILFDFRLKKCQ
ncbi:MAG: hypothetical protein KQA41_03055, partial [Candidatus Aenigmarchaeota archaeon]|nr:hypothetical protein [Candidatus Aenigmarchaeota archaeon]